MMNYKEKLTKIQESFKEASRDEVIDAFIAGRNERSASLNSISGKLVSYNTVIADWEGNKIRINSKKYSSTTSAQTGALKRAAQSQGITIEEVEENVLN